MRPELVLAGLAFFVSGASGLVYQVAWQRILALHSGVGIYSIAMIVGAFMAGLGVGSHVGGLFSLRVDARRSLRLFALVELAHRRVRRAELLDLLRPAVPEGVVALHAGLARGHPALRRRCSCRRS